ncbi:hypothetical protein FRC02_012305 [Tulasnella sp. 418]|nr:hypothetical protein FRC02_012305 [Tulasnella sp. 418]
MEDKGYLDPDDSTQLWALHTVFLPRINRALEAFIQTWNNHKVSSHKHKTPLEIWHRGLLEAKIQGFNINLFPGNSLDDDTAEVQDHSPSFTLYGADFRGAQRERRDDDPHVIFDPPAPPFALTNEQLEWIEKCLSTIDEDEDFYGTEKYNLVLRCIEQLN